MKKYIPKLSEKETSEVEKCIFDLLEDVRTINSTLGFQIYSSKDVCKILNVTNKVLAEYRNNGLLNYSKIGDKYWYTNSDINEFIKLTNID